MHGIPGGKEKGGIGQSLLQKELMFPKCASQIKRKICACAYVCMCSLLLNVSFYHSTVQFRDHYHLYMKNFLFFYLNGNPLYV